MISKSTAQNSEISPNFLLWKFCKSIVCVEVFLIHPQLGRNCMFQQYFNSKKLVKTTVFYALKQEQKHSISIAIFQWNNIFQSQTSILKKFRTKAIKRLNTVSFYIFNKPVTFRVFTDYVEHILNTFLVFLLLIGKK